MSRHPGHRRGPHEGVRRVEDTAAVVAVEREVDGIGRRAESGDVHTAHVRDSTHRGERQSEEGDSGRDDDVLGDGLLTDDHGGTRSPNRSIRGIEVPEVVRGVHQEPGSRGIPDRHADLELLTVEGCLRGPAGEEPVPVVRTGNPGLIECVGADLVLDAGEVPPSRHFDEGVGPKVSDRVAGQAAVVLIDKDEDAVRLVDARALEHEALHLGVDEQVPILRRDLHGE